MSEQEKIELASKQLGPAVADIFAERVRQLNREGYTPEHDDKHIFGELGMAAACYALADSPLAFDGPPEWWPWDASDWKPKLYRENLVRAGALIVAELERIDRYDEVQAKAKGDA